MRFRVTVAETVYTDYFVEAKSSDEARKLVRDPSFRASCLRWADGGCSDDAEVIGAEHLKYDSRFGYPLEEDGDPS